MREPGLPLGRRTLTVVRARRSLAKPAHSDHGATVGAVPANICGYR